jgi:hypothetical protein
MKFFEANKNQIVSGVKENITSQTKEVILKAPSFPGSRGTEGA